MRTFLCVTLLISASCNRPEQTSNEQIANGIVITRDTGMSGNPASYTIAFETLNIGDCSGSLIHPRIVLTAAHCQTKRGIRVAKLDSQGSLDIRFVEQIATNETWTENYSPDQITEVAKSSDFQLLLLDKGYKTENGKEMTYPILPRQEPGIARPVIVSGFGFNETNAIDGKFRKAEIRFTKLVKPSNLLPYAYFSSQINNQTSVCRGDSGGPAVQDGILVAINTGVSWKKGMSDFCGRYEDSFHASVWHAMPWIKANMDILLSSSENLDVPGTFDPLPKRPSIENPNNIYVDIAPGSACSRVTGVFDVLPKLIRKTTGEPGFICSDGNPQTPDPIIRCTSSTDSNSCEKNGFCELNGRFDLCKNIF